jgi:hypothetical protein
MEISEARRIGGKKAAVACLLMLVLYEVMVFFVGSHGDFLTEGRSFMLSQTQPVMVSVVVVAFVAINLLGRVAGKQILILGKNHMVVALSQWAITMGILLVYVWCFSRVLGQAVEEGGTMVLLLGLMVGCVWLIVVRGVKRVGLGK